MMRTKLLQNRFNRLFGIRIIAAVMLVVLCGFGTANAGSFVAECEKNNEIEVRFAGSNCDLVWNKGGESTRCKIKNSVMKFSSYDSAGQATLDLKSGVLKGMGGVYKCTLSGDIQVGKQKKEVKSALDGGQLTEQDEQALVGAEYLWKGTFTRQGMTVKGEAGYEFSLDANGNLIGRGKYRLDKDPKGKWGKIVVRNFRRLTPDEWTNDWKVKSLPGDRCNRTHHCFVFDQTSTNYKNKDNRFKKLVQVTSDYNNFQSYNVKSKGQGGRISVPYERISEAAKTVVAEKKSKTTDTTQNSDQSQDTAVELEFWKSIKSSDDPDMFQAYLDEYPNGKFAPLAKIKIKKLKSSGGGDK